MCSSEKDVPRVDQVARELVIFFDAEVTLKTWRGAVHFVIPA
jgi:hypothetical protein